MLFTKLRLSPVLWRPAGRYVERTLDLPVSLDGPRIGIRPAFDGGVDEGGPADFTVIVDW
jgi:uncharacterized protein YfaS (alpha-2-macroglobulin family)